MLLTLAWRNIWRNPRRSLIVMSSVVIGLMAIMIYDALSQGMMNQMLENQVGAHVAHLQIHKKGFNDNKIIQNYVPNPGAVETALQNHPNVAHYSKRVLTFGIISSTTASSGVSLVGIEPDREARVTKISRSLIAGRYLSGAPHEIVIGQKLAEKLDVGLGDKVVAMASALGGSIGSDMFRVVGVYRTFSSEFDKISVYISLQSAQNLLELGDNVSEFAVITKNLDKELELKNDLVAVLGDQYEVLTYQELLPLLIMQVDMYRESIFIFYAIIGLAMVFGIINTMLMSVFERIQEFGVLMAIGFKNSRLFVMILLEALLLGLVGTAVGFCLGYLAYLPLSAHGLDLSAFAEGLNSFGVGTVIYPVLTIESVLSAISVVPIIAVLGALYPAVRAIRLEPVNAIRYI